MQKYRKKRMINKYKKVFKKGMFIFVFIIICISFVKQPFIAKMLVMETLPFYSNLNSETAYRKPEKGQNDVENNIDGFEVENDIDIIDNKVIGIHNVVFQDEAEFGPLVGDNFKSNLTKEDVESLKDVDYLLQHFYNKDAKAGIMKEKFDVNKLLSTDLSAEKDSSKPQVLIFHTHAGTEFFADSDTSDLNEGVVGAGAELKYILENKYDIKAIHHTSVYDVVDGKGSRSGSYERMEVEVQKIIDENPSIELVIDLHRDGIEPDPQLVNYIDGKPYAKIMFVNGLSAMNNDGVVEEIEYLKNPNLDENLALSFNMQLAANKLYPNSTRKIYLKTYRFSTYMLPKSLLVEIGCQYNTKEEAFNAMEILADLIENVVFSE